MGRSTLTIGTFILISGFVIHQLGFSIVLRQTVILSLLTTIFPGSSPLDLIGTVLEFGGGILGIIGFIICISSVISTQHKETLREITKLRAFPYQQPTTPTRRCKFCGANISADTIFCPRCEKSQK